MEKIRELLELCEGHPVYIQAHNFPDPDALASGHGLQQFLKQFGIASTFCYDGMLDKRACKKMVESFHIQVVRVKEIAQMENDAVLICVDSQKNAGNVSVLPVEIRACIDHHPTFIPAEYQYSDLRRSGSCAAIIAEYFQRAGIEPDDDTASALLYGIKIDTRQFSRGVTNLDIDMFRFLKQFCNEERISRMISNTITYTDLKAYISALENVRIYGIAGFTEIEFPCSDDLIAMIADFLLSLDELDLTVVYSRREDGIKFSVRSQLSEVHAGHWVKEALRRLGTGGGHEYMAGGVIPADKIANMGQYPDETIRDCFLSALIDMHVEQQLFRQNEK